MSKASRNAALALSLPLDSEANVDWALVMLFYAAVHYVEAYFAMKGVHSRSHIARDKAVGLDPEINNIYDQYADLKYFAHLARYECVALHSTDVTERAAPDLAAIKTHLTSLL